MSKTHIAIAALAVLACYWGDASPTTWTNADTLNLLRQEAANSTRALRPPPAGPMLLWTGVGFAPLNTEDIKAIQTLGFNQHLPLTKRYPDTARALQAAGAPIQIMEGLKRFPITDEDGSPHPFPNTPEESFNFQQWRKVANYIDHELKAYENEAISVDALWLDYEGFPFSAPYQSAPKGDSFSANLLESQWPAFRRQLALNLASTYISAPARERFPDISTLNWLAILSFPENPVTNVIHKPTPTSGPTFFTHSNPYAYGNTLALEQSDLPRDSDQNTVDQFYLNLLLRHVSIDAQNRATAAPYAGSVPWVARIVRDASTPGLPTMSRGAYREALRHLWLRDIDGMLVFNSPYLSRDEHQAEILDAAQVWREFEPHYALLKQGNSCNLTIPAKGDSYLWSGKANSSTAVLHFTIMTEHAPEKAQVTIWNKTFNLPLPKNGGKTFHIWRSFGSKIPDVVRSISTTP